MKNMAYAKIKGDERYHRNYGLRCWQVPGGFRKKINVLKSLLSSKRLIWGSLVFKEAETNDGSVYTVITLSLFNDYFVVDGGVMTLNTHYKVENLPEGLSIVITGTSAKTAKIQLTGNAVEHEEKHGAKNIKITFLDDAFVGDDAERITRSERTLEIVFEDAPILANGITLTGDESVTANNESASGTYTATLDEELEGVPVTFTVGNLLVSHIVSISEGEIEDAATGIIVSTNESGVAELVITFDADVDASDDIVASINNEHELVETSASDSITVTVDTTSKASSVTLAGDDTISSDGAPESGTYTASLDVELAGVPVLFNMNSALAEYVTTVSTGSVDDLHDPGITVLTDENGEAQLIITFGAEVEEAGQLSATITNTHELVSIPEPDESVVDTVDISVNTMTSGGAG